MDARSPKFLPCCRPPPHRLNVACRRPPGAHTPSHRRSQVAGRKKYGRFLSIRWATRGGRGGGSARLPFGDAAGLVLGEVAHLAGRHGDEVLSFLEGCWGVFPRRLRRRRRVLRPGRRARRTPRHGGRLAFVAARTPAACRCRGRRPGLRHTPGDRAMVLRMRSVAPVGGSTKRGRCGAKAASQFGRRRDHRRGAMTAIDRDYIPRTSHPSFFVLACIFGNSAADQYWWRCRHREKVPPAGAWLAEAGCQHPLRDHGPR